MMKIARPSKLRVLGIALIFSAVMVLGQTKRADAYVSAEGLVAFFVIAAAATYATVMGVACGPVAAAKSDDYPGGFSAAYGDCLTLELKSDQSVPAEVTDDGSEIPAEEEDEGEYRDRD